MENISRKVSTAHERADSTDEVFGVERQLQAPHNDCRNSKDTCPGSQDTVALIQVLTALIGNFNSPNRKLYRGGLVLWIFHLTANTIWDGYASRDKYGYPWVAVRGLLWVTCIVCTWLTICRTVPWLEQGLGILEFDRQYKDVLLDMSSATRVRLIAYEVYLRTRRCSHSQCIWGRIPPCVLLLNSDSQHPGGASWWRVPEYQSSPNPKTTWLFSIVVQFCVFAAFH